MSALKKVKQEGDIEYLELDRSTSDPAVYVSNDLKIHASDAGADEQQKAIADERAPVEPGVREKKTFIKERNK